METVKLTDTDMQFFAELFSSCDLENVGKVSGVKAADLFTGSQLSPEILNQITDLCGAKRLGHFGRSQFYIALKLIAAAQVGLPLKPESFNSGIEIPLPKFTRIIENEKRWQQQVQQSTAYQTQIIIDQDLIQLQERHSNQQVSVHLPPPPTKSVGKGNSLNQRPTSLKFELEAPTQFPGTQMSQLSETGGDSQGSSPSETTMPNLVSAVIDDTTPTNVTNSLQGHTDKSWVPFQKRPEVQDGQELWDQFDEDRQLLGTEEESSDRHSSDEEYDIWSITEEQREYYTNQFKSMQPDLTGLLSGSVAKDFFEKSKLAVQELSKIWQLSDVNKDGALSLEEFFTAMHLVVLRRNNIELPVVLPPSLIPNTTKTQSEVPESQYSSTQHSAESPPPSAHSPTEPTSPPVKEWTRFNDSPTSSLSSPTSKPVNFDFQKSALEQDPKIFHPVALRLSPEGQMLDEKDGPVTDPAANYEQVVEQQKSPNKRLVNSESQEFKTGILVQTAIQRPVPKKPTVPGPGAIPPPPQAPITAATLGMEDGIDNGAQFPVGTVPASSSTGSFPAQNQAVLPHGPKKEPPPPPPPRPKKNHARSSSLDLNRLGAPPAVPPRMSPSTAGAFEVYKRPDLNQSGKPAATATTSLPAGVCIKNPDISIAKDDDVRRSGERWQDCVPEENLTSVCLSKSPVKMDKHSLRSAIRAQREQNTLLSRLNSELNLELSEVMEERIALEIQLEHLKPFST